MLQIERQNQLLQWLHQQGFLSTIEIANHFKISQMTVWRDVENLEDQGLVNGCMAVWHCLIGNWVVRLVYSL
jgi:DeoR/GlpR family transcriptional regulator of sugar metabolism